MIKRDFQFAQVETTLEREIGRAERLIKYRYAVSPTSLPWLCIWLFDTSTKQLTRMTDSRANLVPLVVARRNFLFSYKNSQIISCTKVQYSTRCGPICKAKFKCKCIFAPHYYFQLQCSRTHFSGLIGTSRNPRSIYELLGKKPSYSHLDW